MKRRKTLNKYLTKPIESVKEYNNKNKKLLSSVFALGNLVYTMNTLTHWEGINNDKMDK